MNVIEIVEEYLQAKGYDGLFNDAGDCACGVSDLAPCGEMVGECRPGYKAPCDCGEHDYHIVPEKVWGVFGRVEE